jgi:hypothetical protein
MELAGDRDQQKCVEDQVEEVEDPGGKTKRSDAVMNPSERTLADEERKSGGFIRILPNPCSLL